MFSIVFRNSSMNSFLATYNLSNARLHEFPIWPFQVLWNEIRAILLFSLLSYKSSIALIYNLNSTAIFIFILFLIFLEFFFRSYLDYLSGTFWFLFHFFDLKFCSFPWFSGTFFISSSFSGVIASKGLIKVWRLILLLKNNLRKWV